MSRHPLSGTPGAAPGTVDLGNGALEGRLDRLSLHGFDSRPLGENMRREQRRAAPRIRERVAALPFGDGYILATDGPGGPAAIGMTYAFPSRRSRVRDPSSASRTHRNPPERACKTAGTTAKPLTRLCKPFSLIPTRSRRSWLRNGYRSAVRVSTLLVLAHEVWRP